MIRIFRPLAHTAGIDIRQPPKAGVTERGSWWYDSANFPPPGGKAAREHDIGKGSLARGYEMSKGMIRLGGAAILVGAFAWAQAGPRITKVDPAAGKAGMNLTITGENLGNGSVDGVLLSDNEKDYPAEMVEQTAEKIVMKVPAVQPAGYNVSIKVGNNIYIQPVRFTVQP